MVRLDVRRVICYPLFVVKYRLAGKTQRDGRMIN
jgi:hypothetical protein